MDCFTSAFRKLMLSFACLFVSFKLTSLPKQPFLLAPRRLRRFARRDSLGETSQAARRGCFRSWAKMNKQASISFSLAFLLPKYTLWLDLEGAEGEACPSPFFLKLLDVL